MNTGDLATAFADSRDFTRASYAVSAERSLLKPNQRESVLEKKRGKLAKKSGLVTMAQKMEDREACCS